MEVRKGSKLSICRRQPKKAQRGKIKLSGEELSNNEANKGPTGLFVYILVASIIKTWIITANYEHIMTSFVSLQRQHSAVACQKNRPILSYLALQLKCSNHNDNQSMCYGDYELCHSARNRQEVPSLFDRRRQLQADVVRGDARCG